MSEAPVSGWVIGIPDPVDHLEGARGLWNPEEKANAAINANVRNTWNRFKNGEIDQPTAQRVGKRKAETRRSQSARSTSRLEAIDGCRRRSQIWAREAPR
jgi:hypothetical protein